MKEDGAIFHAKHAFMPNSLGYCGPDGNGTIREHLEGGSTGERLVRTLRGFDAAYPFLRLIARNAGRDVFDYAVPEAYWIGNPLLDRVEPSDYYRFSREELKGGGMKGLQASLKELVGGVAPHHTFYVMGTYVGRGGDGPKLGTDPRRKLEALVESCRISWGKVVEVGRSELLVRSRPLRIEEEGFKLGGARTRRVSYNPLVPPFGSIRPGDSVSVHWGYACEVLSPRQTVSIERYTSADIRSANALLGKRRA